MDIIHGRGVLYIGHREMICHGDMAHMKEGHTGAWYGGVHHRDVVWGTSQGRGTEGVHHRGIWEGRSCSVDNG